MTVNTAYLGLGGGPNAPFGLGASFFDSAVTTGAAAAGLQAGQLAVVFNASGVSLAWSSGNTVYFFGGSTLSAVQT